MRLLPYLLAVLLPFWGALIRQPAAAQTPAVHWERTFGGSSYEGYHSARVRPAMGGGYWVGAESASPASGDRTAAQRGAVDYWLVKLDNAGRVRWDRAYGGVGAPPNGRPATNYFSDLWPTADGGVLLAGTSNANAGGDKSQPSRGDFDYWLVKLDSLGTKQWDATLGGPFTEYSPLVRQTADGGYLVAGSSFPQAGGDRTAAGAGGLWLVRLNAAGAKLWDVAVGSTGADAAAVLQLTPDGGCLVGGASTAQGPGGTRTAPSRGGADYWLAKLDAQGAQQWDRTVGSPGQDYLYDACPTPGGGLLLAGRSDGGAGGDKTLPLTGPADAWLVQLDAAGAVAWQRSFGQAGAAYAAKAVLPAPGGGYVVFGGSANPVGPLLFPSYWLQRLDAQGQPGPTGFYRGGGYDTSVFAAPAPDGGLLLLGTNECPAGLLTPVGTAGGVPVYCPAGSDDKSQPNRGSYDLWLVKTAPLIPTPARPAAPPAPALRAWPVPAPAGGPVRVALPAPAPPGAVLAVWDLAGRRVARCPLAPGAAQAALPTAGLAPGAYLLQLLGPDGRPLATQRLLLE